MSPGGARPYIQYCRFGSSIRRGLRKLTMASPDDIFLEYNMDKVVMNSAGQLMAFKPKAYQFIIRCRRCFQVMLQQDIAESTSVISYADPNTCKYCCLVNATLGNMVENSFMKSSYR